MAAEEERSPNNAQNRPRRSPRAPGPMTKESILSPGFRSAAAMAGWDEEALLLASLVVEDTPVRESRHRKRPSPQFKTPPTTNSNRKRRSRRQSPTPIPPVVLCLDDEEQTVEKDPGVERKDTEIAVAAEEKKTEVVEAPAEKASNKGLPCMDRLREELSCAICLEICFEPSTTPCGHSFCLKCLKCAAAKCGKRCPKCRQLISNGRSCTVNTVLWNTIQLLFPEEVEARKNSAAATSRSSSDVQSQSTESSSSNFSNRQRGSNTRSSNAVSATQASQVMDRDRIMRRRTIPIQSEDAALALRLQREEFMVAFHEGREQHSSTLHSARANLRAMASRAVNFRIRGRFT